MATTDWASSSASTNGSSSYDVFINFRGEDTRYNFTGFLHKALKNTGINVFFDSEKLWTGEAVGPALRGAIEGSKISITVFSKDYARSKWCLWELAHIVECHKSNNQLVLPIFFHIDPSHVRYQVGSFKEAFSKHEKKFQPDTIKSWRDALELVGNLKGEVLHETRDQAELVELVVKRVLDELISSTHLSESKYLIGIDSPVNDLESLLNIGPNDVQFVGICGFGGIGKTTIAKVVYNRSLLAFNKHSFLSDVREQALQSMGLVSWQKRLLKDIFKIDIDIANYHIGKTLIEARLSKEKVLVVLDDVDSQEQVDALAGELKWFGPGSRIIITTRDEDILTMAKDKIFKPLVLDHEQSLELFSWHAFKKDQLPEDYVQLSHDVVHYSGGLPLTLEVLGSYLSDVSSKKVWECTLQKLKEIPHEKVQRRLKISYDNLDDDQKAIFLDAACFFIGWEKETVISIWEACGYHPESEIYRLIKRSLLKFEVDHERHCCLQMHDQIRDMGRGIVLQESKEPGEHSRLWSYDKILEVLEENKGTGRIKGMSLPYASPVVDLASEPFKMMINLRFLEINSANFMGDILHLPSTLRCFKWTNCPWYTLPINFYFKRLVYLEIRESDIEQAWNVRPQDDNKFQKLKVLSLRDCDFLSASPDFSWFPYLEGLDLRECLSLDKLDESIGQLSQLKYLILTMCTSLKKLPKSIGDLESLIELDLSWTIIEDFPKSISRLSSLKKLILCGCKSLKKLPESVCDLKYLIELDLSCTTMKNLPHSISRMSSLKKLILKVCKSLKKLPESFGDVKSLVELQLRGCCKMKELPDSVGLLEKLEILDAGSCSRLKRLPRSMRRMRWLHSIKLERTRISNIPDDFSMLSNLVELEMSCRLKSLPVNLSHLKKLKQLKLRKCKKLEYLAELPSSLVELRCEQCYSLIRLLDLSRLKNLRMICVAGCEKLEEIGGLEGTESLDELDARGCYSLTRIPRKILGQGKFISDEDRSLGYSYSLAATDGIYNNKGLILCLVLDIPFYILSEVWLNVDFDISASIRQKDKTIRCLHTLRIKDSKHPLPRTSDLITYVHHFKGFDWFGIPLDGRDVIEKLDIYGLRTSFKLKFWKLWFENREPEQQNPNQHLSAMMVASPSDNTEEEEVEEEMDDQESPADNTEEEEEEMDNEESPSDDIEEEEEEMDDDVPLSYSTEDDEREVKRFGKRNFIAHHKEEEEMEDEESSSDDTEEDEGEMDDEVPLSYSTEDDEREVKRFGKRNFIACHKEEEEMEDEESSSDDTEEDEGEMDDELSLLALSDDTEDDKRELQRFTERADLIEQHSHAAGWIPAERIMSDIWKQKIMDYRRFKNVPRKVDYRTHSVLQMRCSHPLIKEAMLSADKRGLLKDEALLKAIERLILGHDEVISPHQVEEAMPSATATSLVDEDNHEAASPSPVEEIVSHHLFDNEYEVLQRAIGRMLCGFSSCFGPT